MGGAAGHGLALMPAWALLGGPFGAQRQSLPKSCSLIQELLLWSSDNRWLWLWYGDRPGPGLYVPLPPRLPQPEPHLCVCPLHLVPGREEVAMSVTCSPMGGVTDSGRTCAL